MVGSFRQSSNHVVCDEFSIERRLIVKFDPWSLALGFIIKHHRRIGIYLTKSLFYVTHVLFITHHFVSLACGLIYQVGEVSLNESGCVNGHHVVGDELMSQLLTRNRKTK